MLFQNELHDWRVGNQANAYFARMGILFGKTRIAFIIEPLGTTIASDFARAHVLVGGRPVFESDAWLLWTEQFREQMPERIKETMADEQARLQVEDPDRARRIRDRLKDVMQLLRPRRFRRDASGNLVAGGPKTGPGGPNGHVVDRPIGPGRRRQTNQTRGIGAVLTQVDGADAEPVQEVFSLLRLNPQWVNEEEADGFAIVNSYGKGLRDRAAALAGEDGATADILLLNRQFRGYQALIAAVNEWANPDGDDEIATKIETFAQEWVEQKMVEAVNGLRQLENGSTWTATNFDDALSPVALTAAFMADRYHTLREVKRQVGPLRHTSARSTSAGATIWLVKCARCGKRYVGGAAHGNGGRYAYYVCFSRQRYGRKGCDADRLPASELEEAILAQLERVLAQEEVVREAIAEAIAELDAERPRREAELGRIDAELRKTDQALGRCFAAFEAGTMTERDCAGRIAELSRRLRGLEARREKLAVDADEAPEPLGEEELHALQAHVRDVIETGEPPARKALLQALVEEIRVVSRAEIYPSFSLPAVRPPSG